MSDIDSSQNGSWSTVVVSLFAWTIIIGAGWFLFVHPGRLRTILFPSKPCAQPIHYFLGSLDSRFGVATSTILQDMKTAAGLWEQAAGKPLFVYDPKGTLDVGFIYDDRQAASDEMRRLGYNISDDRASYDALNTEYESLQKKYASQKAHVDTLSAEYNQKLALYQSSVDSVQSDASVSPAEEADIRRQERDLQNLSKDIRRSIEEVNATAKQMNSMVTVLNGIAKSLNLKVRQAQTVHANVGEEFEEGEYITDKEGERIHIYEFDSQTRLIRVLAHEFGHALGLDHVQDESAIMYYLNKGESDELAPADAQALKQLCAE